MLMNAKFPQHHTVYPPFINAAHKNKKKNGINENLKFPKC